MIMPEESALRKDVNKLFDTQRFAVLATEGNSGPYCSLVAFAASEDLKHLLFATPRHSQKFTNLQKNPRVGMIVDSSANNANDIDRAMGVTIAGKASEMSKTDVENDLKRYISKHANLEGFARNPGCALIRVAVERYVVVREFQKVTEFYPV